MNLEQTTKLVQFLSRAYPNWKPTEGTYAAWALVLGDQETEAIGRAALRWVRGKDAFPPSPGQLLTIAEETGSEMDGCDAWEVLIEKIRRVGYMGTPSFNDEKIARCVRFLGGWVSICSQLTSEVASNRARFIEHYNSLAKRERSIDSASSVEHLLDQADPKLSSMLGMGPRRLIDPEHPQL